MTTIACQEPVCQRPAHVRGVCKPCYLKYWKAGRLHELPTSKKRDVLAMVRTGSLARGPGDCILVDWQRDRPQVDVDGRKIAASRAAWIMANGDPGDLHVLHRCSNGLAGCVRLGHLYLGDHAQNMRDMAASGIHKGERHPLAKLTDREVRLIRKLYPVLLQDELAAIFNVSQATISLVTLRKIWTHVA